MKLLLCRLQPNWIATFRSGMAEPLVIPVKADRAGLGMPPSSSPTPRNLPTYRQRAWTACYEKKQLIKKMSPPYKDKRETPPQLVSSEQGSPPSTLPKKVVSLPCSSSMQSEISSCLDQVHIISFLGNLDIKTSLTYLRAVKHCRRSILRFADYLSCTFRHIYFLCIKLIPKKGKYCAYVNLIYCN
jgi:hypothetical protein